MTDPTAESSPPSDSAKKPGLVRRLYDWVMHWADTPYGLHALAVITLAEASVFPIPPDPLLIALCLGAAKKAFRFAAVATIASVIGGMLGYGIGSVLWASASGFFFQYVPGVTPDAFAAAQGFYDQWDFWAVFIAGLTPFPYKVITISAGVFGINFPVFIVASVVSRGFKYFVLAGLIYRFGDTIRLFIDRYFGLLAWAFGLLVVGGFLLIEVIL